MPTGRHVLTGAERIFVPAERGCHPTQWSGCRLVMVLGHGAKLRSDTFDIGHHIPPEQEAVRPEPDGVGYQAAGDRTWITRLAIRSLVLAP